jgi:hypothetical protein
MFGTAIVSLHAPHERQWVGGLRAGESIETVVHEVLKFSTN